MARIAAKQNANGVIHSSTDTLFSKPDTVSFPSLGNYLHGLCRADARTLAQWVNGPHPGRVIVLSCLVIVLGCGCYGAALGLWRSPLQACYSGLKLPMLVFLTCLTNGLLNSILAMVLGSGLRARQTTISILLSFAIFSVIVGAVSPVAFFMTMNIPPPGSGSESISHGATLLMHTIVIASAGIFGNWKLYQVLALSTPNKTIAGRTLFAWLAGNLFLGAQFSWILRPFFGSPTLAVQFLRDHPMQGNFYEAVYNTLLALLRNL